MSGQATTAPTSATHRNGRMPGHLTPIDRFYTRSHAPTPHLNAATRPCSISAPHVVGGALWGLKQQDGIVNDATVTVGLHEESASRRRSRLRPAHGSFHRSRPP
jgi:hypothetical protein